MLIFKFSNKSYGKNRLELLNKSMILWGVIKFASNRSTLLIYYALEISITIYYGGNLKKKHWKLKKQSKIFVL